MSRNPRGLSKDTLHDEGRRRAAECPRGQRAVILPLALPQLGALAILITVTAWHNPRARLDVRIPRLKKKKQFSTPADIVLLRRVDTLTS